MEQSCDVSQTECGEKSSLFNSEVQEPEGLNMAFLFCAGLLIVFLFLRLWTSSRERKLVIFEEYQNVEDSEELTFLKKACVLVVSYEFENDSLMKRNSIEDDLANLRKTFQLKRNCNYKEIASPNAAELLEILKNEQELLKLFEISAVPAVLFIVLLSHVKSDNIILTDHMDSDGNYKRFETTEIFEAIKNTPDLKDQLNVIFFGPSKGNFDDFSNAEKDSSPEYENQTSSRFIITPRVDNLVLVSSVETNTSLGSTKDGTWFVKEICRMVDDLDKDEPLEVFLTKFQHSAHCNLQEICHTTGENNSSHRNFVICKSVSETEVSSEPQSDWTFMMAARFSDVEMCRSLVENGADLCEVDEFGDDALHLACLEGKLENARYLLGLTGFSVEKRGQFGQTALHKAASKGHVAVAELLLSLGADINARDDNDDTPLILAAQFSSEDMCRFLVEKGADIYSVDKYGEKILHPTCLKMTRENAMYLLRFIDFSVEKKGRSGRTALHKAARKDQVAMVELLLSLGADVNACDDDDDTPLHHAARKGHVAVAKILLSKGADVTARNDDDETPLHRAADNGHVALAELLLSNGSDVNARNKNGYTPLHHAASNGHVSVAELLLSKGADVNARNKNENTPLNVAVQISSKEMCQFLVGHNADLSVVDRNGDNALHLACLEGKLDIVKYFLRLNAFSLEKRGQLGRTALHKAASKGHIAVAELLLSLGADINAHDDNNDTPLILAAQFSSEDMCRFLVEKGTDINSVDKYGENIVHLACLKGTRENAMYLLRLIDFSVEKKGQSGRTALHKAARKDQVAMAELLLSLGADVNACDDDDDTPLHHAARKGHVAVAKILLSKGADVTARNDDDETPLHRAADNGHVALAELLLSNGSDVNARNKNGYTPLHHAASNGHVSVAELLLSKGADVNARNKNENTPLNVAVQISSKEMCQFLVGHNADLSVVDRNGDNALHLACLEGKLDIVKYFLRLNAFSLEQRGQLGRTALHKAAGKGHIAVAELLLSLGADINAHDDNNDTPLILAAQFSSEDMCRFLVEKGTDINSVDKYGENIVHLACLKGTRENAMYLLRLIDFSVEKKGQSGRTALHKAARKDQVAMAELLLSLGADVNACDDDDDTPLHHAARKGHVAVAKILLSKGANVNARNDDDEIPLHHAADNGHVSVAELLLLTGSDVNARDENGYTPLHHAAGNGHVSVAELLLSKGADVNARDENEDTPLNVAAQISSKEMCQFLVGHNADLSAVDGNGDNALHLACLEGKLDIVKYFLRLNAFCLEKEGQLGRTALHHAASKDHVAVAKYLLSKGAEVNATDENNDTPLKVAANSSNEAMFKFLVEHIMLHGLSLLDEDQEQTLWQLACIDGVWHYSM